MDVVSFGAIGPTNVEANVSLFDCQRRQLEADMNRSGDMGGLRGGLAKRAAQKKAEGEPSQARHRNDETNEVLKITTDASTTDVAIPAGFKEQ